MAGNHAVIEVKSSRASANGIEKDYRVAWRTHDMLGVAFADDETPAET
jgi:hypothetical protein